MLLILDTNVLSELMRPRASEQVLGWFDAMLGTAMATTSINETELLTGIAMLPEGRRKKALQDAAGHVLRHELPGGILPFDSDAAKALARIIRARARAGRPIEFQDAGVAAIASVHGASVVTRDERGFAGTGVRIINPWLH